MNRHKAFEEIPRDVVSIFHDGKQVVLIVNGIHISNQRIGKVPTTIQIYHNGLEVYRMVGGIVQLNNFSFVAKEQAKQAA